MVDGTRASAERKSSRENNNGSREQRCAHVTHASPHYLLLPDEELTWINPNEMLVTDPRWYLGSCRVGSNVLRFLLGCYIRALR